MLSRSCAVIFAAISRTRCCAALDWSLPRRCEKSLLGMVFGAKVGGGVGCDSILTVRGNGVCGNRGGKCGYWRPGCID